MILEHYAEAPLTKLEQRELEQKTDHKPRGFWVSVNGYGTDWPEFVRENNFRPERFVNRHFITLADDAKILRISNGAELVAFHNEYKGSNYPSGKDEYIDWERVSGNYDGIIIAPYQWMHRMSMEMFWYYSWDVASGCIWNISAITKIELALNIAAESNKLTAWIEYQGAIRVKRADNMMRFGTEDPTGGSLPMPISLAQFEEAQFDKWTGRA